MADDRLLRAFRELDGPARPDPEFVEGLFGELSRELGLTRGHGRLAPGMAGRRAGVRRLGPPCTTWRTVLLVAAAVVLLVALAAGAALVASRLAVPATPRDLVRESRAAMAQAPAVSFTIQDPLGATTVASDGHGTWRTASWDLAVGSYFLYDGSRVGYYDATLRSWSVSPVADGGPPFPFNSVFAWTDITFPELRATLTPVPCDDAAPLPTATIVGRVADGVACPGMEMRYWIDRETRLVLRAQADEGSRYWNGPAATEVSAFELGAGLDPSAFSWDGPPQGPRTGAIAGTHLTAGAVPPPWTGRTIDGGTVTLPAPGAPAVVLAWTPSCQSCDATWAAFADAALARSQVDAVVVGVEPLGTLAGYASQHPTAARVVADPDLEALGAWGITLAPSMVLLNANGRVVDHVPAPRDAAGMTRLFAALAADDPMPALPALTEPPGTPGASSMPCTGEQVLCVADGSRLPAWSGASTSGETVTSDSLLGRPVVLWLENPAVCAGPCPVDWVAAVLGELAGLQARHGEAAGFLLLVNGETEPGGTARVLRDTGAERLSVVVDWDSAIGNAIRRESSGVVVLDAAGRIAGQWIGAPDMEAVARVLDGLVGVGADATPSAAAPGATGSAVP